jgi:hypothetical protein
MIMQSRALSVVLRITITASALSQVAARRRERFLVENEDQRPGEGWEA